MSGISVESEHLRHNRTADQWFQFGLQRIGLTLFVDLVATDMEREGLGVFRLLGRVVHRFLGPSIQRVLFDSLDLGLPHVIGECIVLAFQSRVVTVQRLREGSNRWIIRLTACHFGKRIA